ncbi:flagellar motor protein MotB [Glaciimonas sp. GNP009]
MSKGQHRIVIRRSAPVKPPQHGGSWKIAYADFMTAMMAFFLVMWLLSISTPRQLVGIAEYFRTPLKVAINGGDRSSMSNSVIPGGGRDPTRSDGEVNRAAKVAADLVGAGNASDASDNKRLRELKKRLDLVIEANPLLKKFKPQLLIDITTEGLRIQIVDSKKRPMFNLSSATVEPYMRLILREIGPVLSELPNKITLSGHTDATPYVASERAYSNWELSADRANASRRELIAGGMAEDRVLRVMGVASSMHLNKADPFDPINRRISIVVLNRHSQEQIEYENATGNEVQTVGSKSRIVNGSNAGSDTSVGTDTATIGPGRPDVVTQLRKMVPSKPSP